MFRIEGSRPSNGEAHLVCAGEDCTSFGCRNSLSACLCAAVLLFWYVVTRIWPHFARDVYFLKMMGPHLAKFVKRWQWHTVSSWSYTRLPVKCEAADIFGCCQYLIRLCFGIKLIQPRSCSSETWFWKSAAPRRNAVAQRSTPKARGRSHCMVG